MPSSALARAPVNRAAIQSEKRTQRLPLHSPWAGYTPDLAVPASMPNGLESCRSLVVSGGVLTPDHGWAQLGADDLPLGNNLTIGYTDSAGTNYGAGMAPATTGALGLYIQPIMHSASFQRFTAASGLGAPEVMAVTADTNGPPSGLGVIETGHLFGFAGGAWVSAEFAGQTSTSAPNPESAPQLPGAAPINGQIDDWVDSTVYPLGITGGNAGGAGTIQPVAESVFLFTNYDNQVMYYPCRTGDDRYSSFQCYANMVDAVGLEGTTTYYSGTASLFTSFRCKTLATFDGRAWYGNTVEGGGFFATRLRRSIVGNPLIVWPGFEIADATLNLNGVGAGFIDLEQLKTPIQRILPLGDLLVVYSKDGIAVVRRTGSAAAPYAIQYITLERGILSPGAVVPISPAQHFAVLTDGWYIISANGTLQEVGITKPAPLKTGELNTKWKQDFYSRMEPNAVDNGHIQIGYDTEELFVRISVPMGAGSTYNDGVPIAHTYANEIWVYDIKNDRAWLDDYRGINGIDQTPVCWSTVIEPLGAAISWADVTAGTATPWSGVDDPGSWDSLTPGFGGSKVVHGDTNGFVYMHNHSVPTRDGQLPEWSFATVPHNYGTPGAGERLLQRIDMEYENNQANTSGDVQVAVVGLSTELGGQADYSETGVLDIERGDAGQMGQDYAHFRVVGDHHQISMSGTGQVKIHSIDLEVQVLEGRYRRAEGT